MQVNVGDALQALSDGVLKSTYHRVRLPESGEPLVRPVPSARCMVSGASPSVHGVHCAWHVRKKPVRRQPCQPEPMNVS